MKAFEPEAGVPPKTAPTPAPKPAPKPATKPAQKPVPEWKAKTAMVPESVSEPEPKPVSEPVPEPVSEAIPEPVTESVPKPIFEPVPEPISKPLHKPVSELVPEQISEPVAEPVSKPLSKSIPEPVSEPAPVYVSKTNIQESTKEQVIVSKESAAPERKVPRRRRRDLKEVSSPTPDQVSATITKPSESVPKTIEKPVSRSPPSPAGPAQTKERSAEDKGSKDNGLPRWLIPLTLLVLLGAAVAALFMYRESLQEKYPTLYTLLDVIAVRGRQIEPSTQTEDVAEAAAQVMESAIPSAEDLASGVESVLEQGDYVCTEEVITPEEGVKVENC